MLFAKDTAASFKQLDVKRFRLVVPTLITIYPSQVAYGAQRIRMIFSKNPERHCQYAHM